ncbi:MAG: type II toxin-antitoxin system PemK/MazF family toxin [Acidobacteriota bacterium]
MKLMKYGMTYNQGSLVLIPFPFTDLSTTKKRPALVVSPGWFNQAYEDVVLAAVTLITSEPLKQLDVPLAQKDLTEGVIPKESTIKISKLFTCHRNLVVREVAVVKEEKLREVLKKLREFFGEKVLNAQSNTQRLKILPNGTERDKKR